ASCRWDIFFALSWVRSHSLNARPFWVVMLRGRSVIEPAAVAAMPQLSVGGAGRLYHPLVPARYADRRCRWSGVVGSGRVTGTLARVAAASLGTCRCPYRFDGPGRVPPDGPP